MDKNGKPCKTCTSSAAWKSMMRSSTYTKKPSTQTQPPVQPQAQPETTPLNTSDLTSQARENNHCPPDVEELGRGSWTLLHTLSATYPTNPTPQHQQSTHHFLRLFSQLYPCHVCAEDFQSWIQKPDNDPTEALKSQEGFGRWMCKAHNEVNRKLGKGEFDCNFWKERWKDGWKDGRCD